MGHHQHRGAPAVDFIEKVNYLKGQRRVNVARGLVGDYHLRVVHKGPRKAHPLALAAGKLGGVVLGLVLKAHKAEHIGDSLAYGLSGGAHHTHGKGHVVVHRHMVDKPEILKHHAHLAAHIGYFPLAQVGDVLAVHQYLSGAGALLAGYEF